MFKKTLDHFMKNGYAHILYALLVELIPLLLLSFAGLFTVETILPGLISTRFVIGELMIIATLLIFLLLFLGTSLGITFPITHSPPMRMLFILGVLWILLIGSISLLSFPLWSIPIFILSFGLIGYFSWREYKNTDKGH